MSLTLFQRLSHAVKVKDLASPLLPDLKPSATLDEAMALQEGDGGREFNDHDLSLVKDNGHILGWVNFQRLIAVAQRGHEAIADGMFRLEEGMMEHGRNIRVREVMYSVDPSGILAGDTPSFTATARLLSSAAPFFLIIDEDLYTGTFAFYDLGRPAFRVCVMSLLLELEELILEWAILHRKESWAALSEGRRAKAIETASRKHPAPTDPSNQWVALHCTMFADKGTIAAKCGLLPHLAKPDVSRLFKNAERVRNACAHPSLGPVPLLPREELWPFLRDCHRAIDSVRERVGG